jgi:hypothetical protein
LNQRKRDEKVEKEELLQFIDSYEFCDLEIGEQKSIDDVTSTIAFKCSLKSRKSEFGGLKSDFLEKNGAFPC